MEASSIVSKARTAFHSAAAKAERVFTDIKKSDLTATDRDSEDQSRKASQPESTDNNNESKSFHEIRSLKGRPPPIKTKQDWQERLKNIRIGRKGIVDTDKPENSTMSFALFDENICLSTKGKGSKSGSAEGLTGRTNIIPSAAVVRQLAVAVEAGGKYKSMKDLIASSRDSSPVRERASLSFSAMKSLVLREKEDRFTSEFGADEKVLSLINLLLDAEGHCSGRKTCSDIEKTENVISLPKDIHGAPPESFVIKLSEVISSLKTLRKMSIFWGRIIAELRRLWSEDKYIPGIPTDEIPDLNCCLLYQKLQVINCCISRKRRHSIATESLEYVIKQTTPNIDELATSEGTVSSNSILHARISTGELVLRLGAGEQSDSLTMLENGEPIYTPIMQEEPLLTEDLIKENEEFVLRTRSVGAGCSQLLSDMQAFKAANPGCILEDFVRWHSPPDWMEPETSDDCKEAFDGGDLLSSRGQLSLRMQKEGNLWRELWETAKPVPAVRQTPLFDEDLAVEGVLHFLEDIQPSELFKQLLVSLIGSGFVTAESTLAMYSNLSKLFYECKDYIVATCQGSRWIEKIDDICQVYETVEMMLINPDEAYKASNQSEETTIAGDVRSRFKRLSSIFGGKDKQSAGKQLPKDQKNQEDTSARQPFSSMFSKKPPKPDGGSPSEKPVCPVENDWTIV